MESESLDGAYAAQVSEGDAGGRCAVLGYVVPEVEERFGVEVDRVFCGVEMD
jgi:hypothetical protein